MANGVDRKLHGLDTFGLEPGRRLAGKYVVGELLGKGWEGEVYYITEISTGIERAAKLFFPERNPRNRTMTFYAKKLDKLKNCSMVMQYHAQETFRFRGRVIPFLVSEYVPGELLTHFRRRQRGKRLHHFEALHLFHALVVGTEEIHRAREYHGDLHAENVIVRRIGLRFDVKVLDMYFWGRRTKAHVLDDICDLVRILYDLVGGARHYANQPPEIKAICCGLKRSLISKKFPSATRLRRFIENLTWD